ncbi:MAG TPA: TetR family transcriptional regulator [Nocardioides sp.]|uniref:TetR family transcriptional regulator n=1 Tax=Nocardioides sp. TaxID=35761 RepID=UPI002BD11897|nr:TetR family transcriptional regulator [Nocardioides sp.]HTW18430.1 TetR family transcriptional regulator [Nocardioides sp.]
MPRVSEVRSPAEPTSAEQRERYRRILRAAARHGAEKGLERVQMHDVARDAGVAIATLYRYFPSKTHLFTALMRSQVDRLATLEIRREDGETPEEAIARLLVRAGRELLESPLLTHAMMQSNNATVAQSPTSAVTDAFSELLLSAGGIEEPTSYDLRVLRLLEEAWYGIVMTAINRGQDEAALASDTELVCRLLLSGRESAGA